MITRGRSIYGVLLVVPMWKLAAEPTTAAKPQHTPHGASVASITSGALSASAIVRWPGWDDRPTARSRLRVEPVHHSRTRGSPPCPPGPQEAVSRDPTPV